MNNEYKAPDLLYTYELGFKSVTEYGISMGDILNKNVDVPKEGARQDVYFKGLIKGEKLDGEIEGVDYIYIRGDLRLELNIFATINTYENRRVSLHATGVAMMSQNPNILDVTQSVTMLSNDDDLKWLNKLHIWGQGEAHLQEGKVLISAYC